MGSWQDRIAASNSLGYAAVAGKRKNHEDRHQTRDYERHVRWIQYRMPELCAAMPWPQLKRLDELVVQPQPAACSRSHGWGSWLIPKGLPPARAHARWNVAARICPEAGISWHGLRDRFFFFT